MNVSQDARPSPATAAAGTPAPDPATGTGPQDRAAGQRLAAGDDRGRTTVSRQAVERIATRLVAESADAGGTARRMLGLSVGEAGQRDATVTARLHGSTAVSLAVRCSVPYPRPVAQATRTLRDLLVRQVRELTGLRVQRVDITITELTTDAGRRRRVE